MAEESRRPEEQQQNNEHKAQQKRRFGAESGRDGGIDEPQHQPAEDRTRDAAETTQDDDDERLQQRLIAIIGSSLKIGAISAPAAAASAKPIAKARPLTTLTFTPWSAAASLSCSMARMAEPIFVFLMNR